MAQNLGFWVVSRADSVLNTVTGKPFLPKQGIDIMSSV